MTSINTAPNNTHAQSQGETDSSAWTIKRLLEWTADYFRDQGADQGRLDAEVLLAEAMECERIDLYTRFDQEPTEEQRARFRDWVRRHGEGEPVAYLVGHREFFSMRFDVNEHVLIPRPETEHLVNETLDRIKAWHEHDPDAICQIVDVGTGSGNVAITLAKHSEGTRIVACDISNDALQVAKRNAQINQVDSIEWVHSDLLEQLPGDARFHFVVSNPPYIGTDEEKDLDRSVVDFEPHQALFSEGPNGTETIQRLFAQAEQRLVPRGWLLMEISPMICEQVCELARQFAFEDPSVVRDLAGLDRIVIARRR